MLQGRLSDAQTWPNLRCGVHAVFRKSIYHAGVVNSAVWRGLLPRSPRRLHDALRVEARRPLSASPACY